MRLLDLIGYIPEDQLIVVYTDDEGLILSAFFCDVRLRVLLMNVKQIRTDGRYLRITVE